MKLFTPGYRTHRFCSAFMLYFLILLLGSIPNARAEIGTVAPGVVLHAVAYGLITVLLATGSDKNLQARLWQAFAIVLIMGAVDEYVQSFFVYRHASLFDWLVDCGASLLMVLIMGRWPKLLNKKAHNM